jgi:hypothetical protein
MLPADRSRQPDTAAVRVAPPPSTAVPVAKPTQAPPAEVSKPAPEPEPHVSREEINPLNLEVTALEMLYQFRMTQDQLEHLARVARKTAGPAPAPREVAVSRAFAATLAKLHTALVENDDEAYSKLSAELEELRSKENLELDEVEITDEARKYVPEMLRGLSARQVASYVTDYADEFPDPREKLSDAFEDVRKLPGREWEEIRDEIAGQVGWLVAGLDAARAEKVVAKVAELLNKVKGFKDEEFKTRRAELDRAATEVVGKVGPTDVIRHFVERSLAELLSNPRLAPAVEARLRKGP